MQLPEPRAARLAISIDVDAARESSFLCTDVLEVLESHDAPALWNFGFTEPPPVLKRIQASSTPHEFGILASADWAGRERSRSEFARQLNGRAGRAARAGAAVIALALQSLDPPTHFDVIAQHGISVLRMRTDMAPADQKTRPSMSRFGIFEALPTFNLRTTSRWLLPWTARRLFQRTIAETGSVHLTLRMEQVADNPAGALASLDYVLCLAAGRRQQGEVEFVPLSVLASDFLSRTTSGAGRSVLRAA